MLPYPSGRAVCSPWFRMCVNVESEIKVTGKLVYTTSL